MTTLREIEERLERLEEGSAYEAIRLAPIDPSAEAQLVMTQADPGGNYPQQNMGGAGGLYWGIPVSTVVQSIGTSGIGSPTGGAGFYFQNLGWGYIPVNSVVVVEPVGSAWFCTINYPNTMLGTSPIDINPQMGPFIFPNPQIRLQVYGGYVTIPCANPWNIMAPAGFPLQVEQCGWGGQCTLTGPQGTITLPATLNGDITTPGGTAPATPQIIGSSGNFGAYAQLGQVMVVDYNQIGGQSGAPCTIAYVGEWILVSDTRCPVNAGAMSMFRVKGEATGVNVGGSGTLA
jgi:hypothetical protein